MALRLDLRVEETVAMLTGSSSQFCVADQPDAVSLAMSNGCWETPIMAKGGVACQTIKKRS